MNETGRVRADGKPAVPSPSVAAKADEGQQSDGAPTDDFDVIREPRWSDGLAESLDLSVIIPASNTEEYLGATLSSLTVQGDLRIEVIVVDYKSTDRTLIMTEEFAERQPDIPVTIVRQNRPGLGDARNFGLRHAKGEFVVVLDSDDFFVPLGYWEMVRYARNNDCDLTFCRGVVFDDRTGESYPFYDNWVWDEVLGSSYSRVISVRREPRLFRLEPNASIRMLRRRFVLDKNIFYPEGKRAEDLVPHYRSLFEADRIGIISRRGFFYRVGRSGKLTTDPSQWIGDLLDAISGAIGESSHYTPTAEMGAAMLYLCVRSAFTYGTQLPYEQRWPYYRQASLIFAQMPERWFERAHSAPLHPDPPTAIRLGVALSALRVGDVDFLVFWSGTPRSIASILRHLLAHPALLWQLLRRYMNPTNLRFALRMLRRVARWLH